MKTAAILASFLAASSAQAAVVTLVPELNDVVGDDGSVSLYLEQAGFSFQTSAAYADPDALVYLHDDSGLQQSVFDRADGRTFTLIDAEWRVNSRVYQTADSPRPVADEDDPDDDFLTRFYAWVADSKPEYANFGWYGYRKSAVVATWEGFLDLPFGELQSDPFGPKFTNLDRLVVLFNPPENAIRSFDLGLGDFGGAVTEPNTVWVDEWSGTLFLSSLSFDMIDTPAPVPLPSGLPLAAAGLGMLVLAARRRKM